MKKVSSGKKDEMRPEYTRADFPSGFVRGKYAARIAQGSNIVVLKPDVAAAFPTTDAVNEALSSLIRIAQSATHPTLMRPPVVKSNGRPSNKKLKIK